jgi:hypothetical protein
VIKAETGLISQQIVIENRNLYQGLPLVTLQPASFADLSSKFFFFGENENGTLHSELKA